MMIISSNLEDNKYHGTENTGQMDCRKTTIAITFSSFSAREYNKVFATSKQSC